MYLTKKHKAFRKCILSTISVLYSR